MHTNWNSQHLSMWGQNENATLALPLGKCHLALSYRKWSIQLSYHPVILRIKTYVHTKIWTQKLTLFKMTQTGITHVLLSWNKSFKNNNCYNSTMECNLAIKKNKFVIYTITWMNLKYIFPSLIKSNLKGYVLCNYIGNHIWNSRLIHLLGPK